MATSKRLGGGTNLNTTVEVIVLINGQQYYRKLEILNSYSECYQWQTRTMAFIEQMKLSVFAYFK